MESVTAKLDNAGRLVLPSQFRKELGLKPGSEVIVACDAGEIRVFTRDQAIRRIQERLRQLVPPGVSVVDELIAERREEARREFADD